MRHRIMKLGDAFVLQQTRFLFFRWRFIGKNGRNTYKTICEAIEYCTVGSIEQAKKIKRKRTLVKIK